MTRVFHDVKYNITIKHHLTHTSGFGSLKAVNMIDKEKLNKEKTVNIL